MVIRFGVIGSGMMGCEHIRNLVHVPGVDLVAVADPNEKPREWALKACGTTFQPKIYKDYRQLLDLDLDAVIIASPNYTHIEVVRDFADSPFHLLLEKPMCTTVDDARALVELDKNRDPITCVALEYRYMSATAHFLERLPEVGELKMLFIREHRFPFLKKVNNWNRFNRNTGGTLIEKCCHFFDLMNLATGANPVKAIASGAQDVNHLDERYNGEQPDILDNAFVIVEYDNGIRACLDLCMFAEGSRNEQELVATGNQGKLEIHIPENLVSFSPRKEESKGKRSTTYVVKDNPDIRFMGLHHGASYLEQLDFINAIKSGREPTVTTYDGFRSVAVGAAAQRSIERGGAPVNVEQL